MKKLLLMSFLMTFTILLGVTLAYDGNDRTDLAEQARIKAELARMEALRDLTSDVQLPPSPVFDLQKTRARIPNHMINAIVRPATRPIITTNYLFDDFEDGDYTNNPTWTMTSNGNGNGLEDWTVYADPWSYNYGTVTHNGTGYLVGSDSDGGGALADEELEITFNTPGGGGELTMYYWVHFRAYIPSLEYLEILVDATQVDIVTAPDDTPVVGDRMVILDAFNDGASHTLTIHYYADYGYVGAVDDVVITDDPRTPCFVDCPPGATAEGEPDCYIEYDDFYNSGCNSDSVPVYVNVACGDTICGKSGVYRHSNPDPPPDSSTYRDTDWYRLVLTQSSDIYWAGVGEFPFQLLLMDAGSEDCVDYDIVASGTAARCDTLVLTYRGLPGVYWLWAGPSEWNENIQCDGNGAIGNNYVAWVECVPTPPCPVDEVIGDINSQLPYANMGNTTFGSGNDFDETCIQYNYDSGEDYIFEMTVSAPITLDIIMDPHETAWTGILIDDFCPPDTGTCIATSVSGSFSDPHGFEQLLLQPGTYWIMVDSWSAPDSIPEFDLFIAEGVLTLGLAETGNIPDCGVSNFGPLGETDAQGNTYGWNTNDPANFAGTFVMGNSTTTMFSYYNQGISDCLHYNGVTGLNLVDPFHPTSRYDDDGHMNGVTIEYCGHGFTTAPGDDIFMHVFKVTNNSGSAINDFYAGVYFDWDIDTDNGDTVIFDRTNNVIIQAPLDQSIFYGLCLANAADVNLRSMTAVSQQDYIYPSGPSGGGWLMEDLFTLMSYNGDQIADSMYLDMSSLLSSGPHSLADGDSVIFEIAVIGAQTLADVQSRAQYAAGLTIADCIVAEPPPPTGRCCYESAGDTLCVDNTEAECTTLGGYNWNQFLNCTDNPCVLAGCPYIVGDVNGSNNYNGLDITYGVAFFKGGAAPQCPTCPIPDCNWNYCGDVNSSCNYNGLDITYGVAYFKGGAAPVPCVDCPPIE